MNENKLILDKKLTKTTLNSLKNRGLSGIMNIGNTCFMNAAIQCLSNTNKLTWYILSGVIDENISKNKKEYILLNEYRRLLTGMWEDNCIVKPLSFKETLSLFKSQYIGTNQHDSHEVIITIINLLHNICSYEVNITIEGNVKNDIDKLMIDAIKSWEKMFKNEYSFIVELFYGQFHSRTTCVKCNSYTNTFDPYCYISLPINNKTKTIYDCFSSFTNSEILDSDNKWKCNSCNHYSNAHKKIVLWKTPEILIISFKRFTYDGNKINNCINFPINGLNLQKWTNGYDKYASLYDLYSVCNHTGSVDFGHYYSFCKNMNNNWYCYNDASVTNLEPNKIVSQNAYILFYQKRK